jgi:putative redox protein
MGNKKMQVTVKQGAGFKTECRAGKHTLFIDQPTETGGTDAGPTPLDYQLMALGGCIAAVGRIIASQRKLALRGIEVALEGELDTSRLLGKTTSNRAGFVGITARVKIDADLPQAEKEKLVHEIEERCPVSDNLANVTPIQVVLADQPR